MDGRARLAWNVRRHRTDRGITQEQLAVDAGMPLRHVSRIERSDVNASIDVIERLARALDVPIDTLLAAVPAGEPPKPLRPGRKPKAKTPRT